MIETLLKYLNPTYLIAIGAFISIIGSILASKQSDIEVRKTNDKLESVSKVTAETNKQITGGDSYCSMIVTFNAKTNEPRFDLMHVGDTKIEKVQIIISDLERIKSISHLATTDGPTFLREYNNASKKIYYDILYPSTLMPNLPIQLFKGLNNIDLLVDIRFGNRSLHQSISVTNYKTMDRIIKSKLIENDQVIVESEIPSPNSVQ